MAYLARRDADHHHVVGLHTGERADDRGSGDVVLVLTSAALIEPGRYEAVGGRARPAWVFKTWKWVVPWTISTPEDTFATGYRNVVLFRHYNLHGRKNERQLHIPTHGDLARDLALVAGRRFRHDRIPALAFMGVLATVQVVTVTHDHRQRLLPEHAIYSKIGYIAEVKAGRGRAFT